MLETVMRGRPQVREVQTSKVFSGVEAIQERMERERAKEQPTMHPTSVTGGRSGAIANSLTLGSR